MKTQKLVMLAVAGAATTGVIWYFKTAGSTPAAAGAAKPAPDAAAFTATNPNSFSSLLGSLFPSLFPSAQTTTPAPASTTPAPASSVTASMNPSATSPATAAHISAQQFDRYFRSLQSNPNAVPPGPLGPKQQAKVDKLKRERAAKANKRAHAAARLGSAGQPGDPTPRIETSPGVTGGLKSPATVTDSYKSFATGTDIQKPSSVREGDPLIHRGAQKPNPQPKSRANTRGNYLEG